MKTSEFYALVYKAVQKIPPGSVTTYGRIAAQIGFPQNSRLVGRAMAMTPAGKKIPSHRVVSSSGGLVPNWEEQKALLLSEGVLLKENGRVDLKQYLWHL